MGKKCKVIIVLLGYSLLLFSAFAFWSTPLVNNLVFSVLILLSCACVYFFYDFLFVIKDRRCLISYLVYWILCLGMMFDCLITSSKSDLLFKTAFVFVVFVVLVRLNLNMLNKILADKSE